MNKPKFHPKFYIYLLRVQVSGKPHVIRFMEGFGTLTINGHPFRADFGGFPMVVSVGGQKHYLRLTTLPHGVGFGDEETTPVGGRAAAGKPPSPRRESGIDYYPTRVDSFFIRSIYFILL